MSAISGAMRQRQFVIWLMIFAVAALAAPLAHESQASAGGVAGDCVFAAGPDTFSSVHLVPVAIPDDDPAGVEDCIAIDDPRTISDLTVALDIGHTWVGDLVVTLTHEETGTSVTLIDRPGFPDVDILGCTGDDIVATLDDDAAGPVEAACDAAVPTIDGAFIPSESLSAFDDESIAGIWTLTITDHFTEELGALNSWSLIPELKLVEACHEPVQNGHIFASPLEDPLPIPDDDVAGVEDCITIDDDRTINSLSVALEINHTRVEDLVVTLTHVDTDSDVQLLFHPTTESGDPCPGDNIDAILGNLGGPDVDTGCSPGTPTIVGKARPTGFIGVFDGESMAGTWTLRVFDEAAGELGSLVRWSIIGGLEGPPPVCPSALGSGNAFSDALPGPLPIPRNDSAGVIDCMTIEDDVPILDLDVALEIDHTFVSNLVVRLTHDDTGTTAVLIDRPGIPQFFEGCGFDNIRVVLNDEASSFAEDQCGGPEEAIVGEFIPSEPLSAFDGESMAGTWTLHIVDEQDGDRGDLIKWTLIAGPEDPAPTATPQATETPLPPNELPGDVNCDSSVNAIDAALILQFGAGLVGALACQQDADVNGDGTINAVDAALILQFTAGLIASLPP